MPVGWGLHAGRTSQATSVYLVASSPRRQRAELWGRQGQTSGYRQSAHSLPLLRATPPKPHTECVLPYPTVSPSFPPSPEPRAPDPEVSTLISAFLLAADLMAGILLFGLKFSPQSRLCLHFVPFACGDRMASPVGSWRCCRWVGVGVHTANARKAGGKPQETAGVEPQARFMENTGDLWENKYVAQIKCAYFAQFILQVKSQQQEILILMPDVGQESGKDGPPPHYLEKGILKEPP